MTELQASNAGKHPLELKAVLVGEFPPPAAGMAVQAESLMQGLQSLGVAVVPVRVNRHFQDSWTFVNRLRGVRGLLRFLAFLVDTRQFRKVDLVHVFSASGLNYYLYSVPSLLIARLAGKPCIIHYHGGAAEEFFKGRRKLLDWSMRRAATLVVPSAYLGDIFKRFGFSARIIPNIAGIERFHYREREQAPPHIIMARNLTATYNIECGVRAFAEMAGEFPGATLTIAGDGPRRHELERLVEDLDLQRVSFLGNVPNEQMPRIFEQASLLLNTSNVDNMPGSILEAFASGLPVVSTAAGGIPYLVKQGETGLLAPVNDHRALAKHLLAIARDQEKGRQLARAALACVTNMTASRICLDWKNYYEEILETID